MLKKLLFVVAFLGMAAMPSSRNVDEADRLVAQAIEEMSTLEVDPGVLDLWVDPRDLPDRPLGDEQLVVPPPRKYRSI